MKTLPALTAALSLVAATSAAAGNGSYSGRWPLTVTNGQGLNGNYCLTVTDDGGGTGTATIPEYQFGVFEVINGVFTADIVVPLEGQNGVLIFTASGKDGKIGKLGSAVQIEGGEPLYAGAMAVGKRNSC